MLASSDMSEEQTTQAVVDETKAPAQPGAEETSARNDDGFDSLLNEFDQKTKSAPDWADHPTPDATSERPSEKGYSEDDLMRLQLGEIGNRVMLQSVLEHQIAHSERLHQEQLQRQEREDWSEVLDEAVPYLAELPGIGDPRKEATRWLLSQAQLDPRLAEAWQHRRDSPQHQAHAVSVIKRAYKTMHAELSRRPDADLTEDRWAVAAFMRGGSKTPPPAKVPDYSKMTEAQLAAEWAKVGTHPATAPG